jgi:molybdopterin converting factor small subunit
MAVVKLFGAFQDRAGWSERVLEVATLGEAVAAIAEEGSELSERLAHRSTLVILNATILPWGQRSDDLPLAADDEIAFGPPVSGG